MNIESKLWQIRSNLISGFTVTQKASGVTRYFSQAEMPRGDLAAMSEREFDGTLRRIFHAEEEPKSRKGIY